MATLEDVRGWRGMDLHGEGEEKIGEIKDIYLDRSTDEPEWAAVKTGLLGSSLRFVPIAHARAHGDHVDVPYAKDAVKDAPNVDADGELSPEEERRLYDHYGVAWGEDDARETVGHGTSGPETDGAMTRSEEEMVVGTRQEEIGRARLRKYIETEDVQQTVPVSREEVVLEREPITDDNAGRATDGPALSEEEHEVALRAEEAVVEKRVVPKERVRLDKETHVEEQAVSGEVRKERIEADTTGR